MTDNIKNSNFNILVVDDEEIVVSLVCDALEDDGFNVQTATESHQALEIIKNQSFDLIISDIRMPKMSGIELIKKTKECIPDISFIFMTGYANLNSAKDAIKQGASDYILKPFELNEIRQAVYKAIDKLKENMKADQSEKQLNRLSDLHHMLFTAGDKTSLMNLSLKFAMMQFESQNGAIISWDNNCTNFKLISNQNENLSETDLDNTAMTDTIDSIDLNSFQDPLICNNLNEHPFIQAIDYDTLTGKIDKIFNNDNDKVIFIPISRTYSIYGFFIVSLSSNKAIAVESNLKFLTITAHQLAMSLENLELLKETQNAYSKLKEAQDETIQLEKMATKGEISAEIGHELNNFLGVIAGSLSLMEFQLQKNNYDDLNRHIQNINDNIEKMKKFTSNLMDYQTMSIKKEIIDFDNLLADVIEFLKPQKRFDKVKIKFEPSKSNLPLNADPTHIQQLLYNLLNNAADAMNDRDEKELTIKTSINKKDNSFVVTIKDTGCGFPPDKMDLAFKQKFTSKKKGHGFGLLVCRRIIDSHEGKLSVDSIPDKGTTINITFPVSETTVLEPVTA